MNTRKKCKVEVKRDHLSKIASASPEFALAEMIWNAVDADATKVEVIFREDEFGVNEVVITDNGTGIPYSQAEVLFVALGGSWKAQKQKTQKGRFLHGKDGEGRFKAFALGHVVQWIVVYETGGELRRYAIEGRAESLDEFILTDEEVVKDAITGVQVQIMEINKKFHVLSRDKAIERLTPILAPYLSNYPSVSLSIDGIKLDPAETIKNKKKYTLTPIEENGEQYPVELDLIEWNSLKERELWLCDSHGFPLELYNRQIRGIGDYGFSGYLKSPFIERMHEQGILMLGELNAKLNKACEQAIKSIKEFFLKRTIESAREQLEKWKQEKVYPYGEEPQTPVEIAERQVFDIVALHVNQNLPDFEDTDRKTKAFQFRMLRQAIERSPEDLQLIINEVLQLPKEKQEQLAELLRNTSLAGIISASRLVTDRLSFVSGLEHMLFDEDMKKHLKERAQLHRILAENTWVFGHAFSLSVDDKLLTEVLRKHAELSKSDIVIDEPVKRIDESTGIVDLMLSRAIPRNHSNELEHLIVELKAPRVIIGEKEIQQIKSYAFAVAKDERFRGLDTQWHFWIISNDYDDYAEMELSQDKFESGVIYKSAKPIDITIWVKTWSQLLQENKHKLQFIREKLNYSIDREEALAHLKKTYAELTEGILPDESQQDEATIAITGTNAG